MLKNLILQLPVLRPLGLAVVVALAAAAPAAAAAVGVSGSRLVYGAGAGETNDVTIIRLHSGELLVSDRGAALAVTGGCSQLDFHNARCDLGAGEESVVAGLGDGDDQLRVENVAAVAYGGPGNDAITTGAFDDVLSGGPGADRLLAGPGNDRLAGDDEGLSDGASALTQAADDDVLVGGAGDDEVIYRGRSAPVRVDLHTGASGQAGERDTVRDVEDVVGGDAGDTLTGDRDDNRLIGGPGSDRLTGARGNDLLVGATGRNVVRGGSGNDEVDASGARMSHRACGRGTDVVFAPRRGRTRLGRDCERVMAGPDPQTAPVMDAWPSRLRGRTLVFDTACPETARRCRVALRVLRHGRTLARGHRTLRRGRAWGIQLKLTRRGRQFVEAGRARRIEVRAGGRTGWTTTWKP